MAVRLDAKEKPTLHAAVEWRDSLLLSYPDGAAGRVAAYDPARAAWSR